MSNLNVCKLIFLFFQNFVSKALKIEISRLLPTPSVRKLYTFQWRNATKNSKLYKAWLYCLQTYCWCKGLFCTWIWRNMKKYLSQSQKHVRFLKGTTEQRSSLVGSQPTLSHCMTFKKNRQQLGEETTKL